MSDYKFELKVPFPSKREADIACHALQVEIEPPRSMVEKKVSSEDNVLSVTYTGSEARKIRTAVSAFYDCLIMIIETLQEFDPKNASQ